MAITKRCSVSECEGAAVARNLCWKHYTRQRRWGNVHHGKRPYRSQLLCRWCGASDPGDFYSGYKTICKTCRKLKTLGSL